LFASIEPISSLRLPSFGVDPAAAEVSTELIVEVSQGVDANSRACADSRNAR